MGDGRPPWKRRADGNAEMMRDSEPALMLKMGYARSEGWAQEEAAITLLLVRELPAQALPCGLHAAADAVLLALYARGAGSGGGGVLALGSGLHLVDEVAGTAATDVVDGCLLGAEAFLLLEFLVEAKDGTLRLLHVASTATAGGVEGVAGWGRQLGARSWT
jgi:hypothetical protein